MLLRCRRVRCFSIYESVSWGLPPHLFPLQCHKNNEQRGTFPRKLCYTAGQVSPH
jgi:hypothetical protein